MQLREITARLKGVKGGGRQYTALCPAHADKNPSLSISEKDGKILLHCHAGCSNESILSAIGLEMKDLFIEGRATSINENGKSKREIAAVYDYKDLDGNIIHSTIRYYPKSFRQRRPDPDKPGEYIWKEVFKDITPILYNLQAVTKATHENRPIFIVEGEKDCETLAKLDYAATTCPMGAGKWRKEYSDTLKGAAVYIIADIDETGKNHAQSVVKSLVGKANEVSLIDLAQAKPEAMTDIPQGWDITDLIEATPQEKRIAVIAELIANAALCYSNDESDGGESTPNGKKNAAEQLIKLVESSGANFFHSDVKDLYATIQVENHIEVLSINSRDFELWLNGMFYRHTGKPITKDGVKQVLAVLSSKALFDNTDPITLSTRIAEHEEAFWYDLSNKNWQAVRIDNSGWEITDNPPILFSRYRHQLQQALPKHGGNINKMLDYINIKESKTLFLCWLVSCFIPNIPHAAIIIHGEKGAAKSTASGLLKSLIDPSALDTLTLQNDQRTMAVNLLNHWFLPFDNVSFINEETSDTLCRAITGGGIQQRRLHTNSEDTIFTFQRCVAINGIHNVATRADLLDRSILIELIRITDSERKELSAVLANFEADKADILGGIFDTVVKAMNIFPSVKLQNLPRMADFARWGYAIGEALGEGLGQTFLNEYTGNRQIQNEEAIANDPVATLIVEFMKNRQEWTGLFSTLYRLLSDIAEDNGISVKHKSFPANAIVLSKRITAIKSNLENIGIYCVSEKRNKHGQNLSIKRSNSSTPITSTALTAENGGFGGVECGADRVLKDVSAPITTPHSTPEKTCNYWVGVDNVGGVDKNDPFMDYGFMVVEDIADSEIPPEFLKPTPTLPTQKETHKQLSL